MVTFAEDALVNDQLRDYWGKLVITEWAKRDIVGERLTMNVMGTSSLRPMSTATMTSAACLIRWCSPSISALERFDRQTDHSSRYLRIVMPVARVSSIDVD
jgi:hypothetical protein